MNRILVACALVGLVSCAADPVPPSRSEPSPSPPPSFGAPSSRAPAVASAPAAAAQPATAPPLVAGTVAYDLASSLADEVGPRLTGSAGTPRAVAWALAAMKKLGFENVHAESVTAPVWERGAEEAQVVAPHPQKLVVTALGWSPATPPRGVEAEVIEVDSIDALKARGEGAVRGKIVFFNRPVPKRRDGSGYGEVVGLRFAGPIEAGQLGAAAVLVRSVGTDRDRVAHTGATSRKAKIPSAAVSVADAELLHRALAAGPPVRVRLVLTPKTKADVQTANVVGDVIGASKPSEIVLLGAHLDSWDLGHGAVDDAAGCGIVMAAAEAIARGSRPARTVRVVLFAAEESSGAGSAAYAKAHAAEAEQHVLAMEADAGTGRVFSLRFVGAPERTDGFFRVAPRIEPLGVTAERELASGGADVGPLRALGVPVADLRQDMSRYFDVHHTANDTVAELDADALVQATSAFAAVARFAADEPDGFGRIPAALRDKH